MNRLLSDRPTALVLALLVTLLPLAGTTIAQAAPEFRPVLSVPRGSGPGQTQWVVEDGSVPEGMLMGPAAFLVDGQGRLHLGDTLNHRILVFRGKALEKTIPLQPGPGFPEQPLVVALVQSGDGGYLVGDAANNRVLRISRTGGVTAFGGDAQDPDDFLQIDRIHLDGAGRVFVEDHARQQTVVFSPDGRRLATYRGETGIQVSKDGDFTFFLYQGEDTRREIHRRDPASGKESVVGVLHSPRPISSVIILGSDARGRLHYFYDTEDGRTFTFLGPDGTPGPLLTTLPDDPGLDALQPVVLAPDGGIYSFTLDGSSWVLRKLQGK